MYTEDEWEADMKKEESYWKSVVDADEMVMKALNEQLPKDMRSFINYEYKEQHICSSHLEIVDVSKCKGERQIGKDYFGESTPIKTVYDDTSNCSYSGSYGGDIYIHLGRRKYLKMSIHG